MSGNKFQIKRTGVSGRQPNTTNESNSAFIDVGELALNFSDGILYSSDGNNAFEVGANVTNQTVNNELVVNTATVQQEFILPIGNTALRPANASVGSLRFNTELNAFEGYDGANWLQFAVPEFAFEGDLQTLDGTEDLQEGSGVFDLSSYELETDLQSGDGSYDLQGSLLPATDLNE